MPLTINVNIRKFVHKNFLIIEFLELQNWGGKFYQANAEVNFIEPEKRICQSAARRGKDLKNSVVWTGKNRIW